MNIGRFVAGVFILFGFGQSVLALETKQGWYYCYVPSDNGAYVSDLIAHTTPNYNRVTSGWDSDSSEVRQLQIGFQNTVIQQYRIQAQVATCTFHLDKAELNQMKGWKTNGKQPITVNFNGSDPGRKPSGNYPDR